MEITVGRCGKVNARVKAPPSKSYTHRALILAGLAEGTSVITGQLDADDTRITARALSALGIRITWEKNLITVHGMGGKLRAPSFPIDIEDSGTSMRLLTAVCLLANGEVTLTGSNRMKERPIGPLVDALNHAGGRIRYGESTGCPPLIIEGELRGGNIQIDSRISSQFISSLLIASPYAGSDSRILLSGPAISEPYIRITAGMMDLFGVYPEHPDPLTWIIPRRKKYRATRYTVEGDYSSCSYWFAFAAITGGNIVVEGLNPESIQGDRKLLDILMQMGCSVRWEQHSGKDNQWDVMITRAGTLKGISVDMADCPDVVQTLAMVAAVADSPTRITGIHHLREKESDRVTAIVSGLHQLGIEALASEDEICIFPGSFHHGVIHPLRDHRTAMCFAILGTVVGDVTILDAGCVTKSYPEFWEVFGKIWKTGGSC